MIALSPTFQSILYAGITKSVGSVFRVKDDWHAPPGVLRNTVERESILLGLTTVFTTGIQMLFTGILSGFLERHPKLGRYELIWRALATAPALLFAESFSRELAPKTPWGNLSKPVTLIPPGYAISPQRQAAQLVAAAPMALHRSPFFTNFEKPQSTRPIDPKPVEKLAPMPSAESSEREDD